MQGAPAAVLDRTRSLLADRRDASSRRLATAGRAFARPPRATVVADVGGDQTSAHAACGATGARDALVRLASRSTTRGEAQDAQTDRVRAQGRTSPPPSQRAGTDTTLGCGHAGGSSADSRSSARPPRAAARVARPRVERTIAEGNARDFASETAPGAPRGRAALIPRRGRRHERCKASMVGDGINVVRASADALFGVTGGAGTDLAVAASDRARMRACVRRAPHVPGRARLSPRITLEVTPSESPSRLAPSRLAVRSPYPAPGLHPRRAPTSRTTATRKLSVSANHVRSSGFPRAR